MIAEEIVESLIYEVRSLDVLHQRRRADLQILENALKPFQKELIAAFAADAPKRCAKCSLEFRIVPHQCVRIPNLKEGFPVLLRFWPHVGSFGSSASNTICFGGFIPLFKHILSLKQPGDDRKAEDIIFGLLGRAYLMEVQKAGWTSQEQP